MTRKELNNIDIGAPVSYAFFKNLSLLDVCDEYVTMGDSNGDNKKVYTELFLKYGKAI
jgi:hypothetical protein